MTRPPKITGTQIERFLGGVPVNLPIGFTLNGHMEAIENYVDNLEKRAQDFQHDGPLPAGYIIEGVMHAATGHCIQQRAALEGESWRGPWHGALPQKSRLPRNVTE